MDRTQTSPQESAPNHPVSARLEQVRQLRRVPSKRAFWQQLVEGWEDDQGMPCVSYPAVKNYHQDREPPVSYIARVAKVFDVRVEWLITGEGEPTESAELVKRSGPTPSPTEVERIDLFAAHLPDYAALDPAIQTQVTTVIRWLLRPESEELVTDARLLATAQTVIDLLLAPLDRLHGWPPSLAVLGSERFTDYATVALSAISVAARFDPLLAEISEVTLKGRKKTPETEGQA